MGSLAILGEGASATGRAIEAMLSAAPHRGRSTTIHHCGDTILGVATRDQAPDAWLAHDNGHAAALVGSLENARELAERLTVLGFPDAESPARILLSAFRAWGERAPNELRGSFAGAFSDGRTLWCFRDHLGLRPLFFRHDSRGFAAASEPKQVLAAFGLTREPDPEALEEFVFARLPEERTAVKGVARVPKASIGSVSRGQSPTFALYWDPSPLLEGADLDPEQAAERLAAVLERAIGRAVTGEDAISLSGGVDSAVVAAFAARAHAAVHRRSLIALSAVYPHLPRVDERPYIELIAARLDLPLHTYVQHTSPLDGVERWVDLADGPWDTLPLSEVAEHYALARQLGARTVFTGDLVELACTMRDHLIGHLVLHGRWRAAARWVSMRRERGRSWAQIARETAPSLTPAPMARLYAGARRARLADRDRALLPPWLDPMGFGGLGYRPGLAVPARRRWLEGQLAPLGPFATTTAEALELCAVVSGVEVKRPLVDVDVWEFFLSLPAETKFPDRVWKSILRRAARGRVPDAILDRREKTAFDDHVRESTDWSALLRLTKAPNERIRGVDYALLADRIERRTMSTFELVWAHNVARAHAFLGLWA